MKAKNVIEHWKRKNPHAKEKRLEEKQKQNAARGKQVFNEETNSWERK